MSYIQSSLSLTYKVTADKRVPFAAKLVTVICLSYVLWPFDLIPDNIPFWGYSDDLLVVVLSLLFIKCFIPYELLQESSNSTQTETMRSLRSSGIVESEGFKPFSEIKTLLFTLGLFLLLFVVMYKACTVHWPKTAHYMYMIGALLSN